ncbi:MAG TPA: alpha/beta hydrolase-fold protein [Bacteroidales bacterium]|nr:alpha/beta hydrolase-fold protein [Bacteroidales bacterium]
MKTISAFLFVLLFVFGSINIALAQEKKDKVETDPGYGKLEVIHSNAMNRDLPVLVFLPAHYQKNREQYPVIYFLHGTNDQPLTEKGLRTLYHPGLKIKEMADMFHVIIVTPIVGNSYYMNSPVKPGNMYATYVGEEIPAFIDDHYRTQPDRDGRILAGFSMGGYGAVSLLCRYPDVFSVALERSGVLNLATAIEDLDWDNNGKLNDLLGDYWTHGENYHLNSCFNLVNHIRDRKDVAIVMEIGRDDFLYKTNYAFHQRLVDLGFKHIYAEYPGGHYLDSNVLMSLFSQLQYFRPTR